LLNDFFSNSLYDINFQEDSLIFKNLFFKLRVKESFKSILVFKRIQDISKLSQKDKELVFEFLNSFMSNRKIKKALIYNNKDPHGTLL